MLCKDDDVEPAMQESPFICALERTMRLEELCFARIARRWHLNKSSNFLKVFFALTTFFDTLSDSLSDKSESKDQSIVGKGVKAVAESRAIACSNRLFMLNSTLDGEKEEVSLNGRRLS